MKKRRKSLKTPYIILACIVIACFIVGIILSQQSKLNAIKNEQAMLQEELDALKVEEQRLNQMLDYVQTDGYLLQYAREQLGYTLPDDIKFYKDK